LFIFLRAQKNEPKKGHPLYRYSLRSLIEQARRKLGVENTPQTILASPCTINVLGAVQYGIASST